MLDATQLAPLANAAFRDVLFELARRHGVLGLVVGTLARPPLCRSLPYRVIDHVGPLLMRLRLRTALWLAERDRVLAFLGREGLDPVVLKGGALCTALYPEPADREFGDLDLLVPEGQVQAAVASLLGAGYQNPWNEAQLRGYHAQHFHVRVGHPQGFVVEIHFGLTKPGAPFRLEPAEFLNQSVVREGGRTRLRLPRWEHLALHTASQSTQNHFDRLARLVDFDRIASFQPRFDWLLLEETARRGGLAWPLAVSLQLARRIMGTEIPAEVLDGARPGFVRRLHVSILKPVSSLLDQSFPKRATATWLLNLWLMTGVRRRADYLRRVLTDRDAPLRWIWEGKTHASDRSPTFASILLRAAKLAAQQVGLYLTGAAAFSTRRGRVEMRFWSV